MACFDCDQEVKVYSPMHPNGEAIKVDTSSKIILQPGDRALIPTGLKMELPLGKRFHITPRSGWALKKGVTILNTPGKIDSDYRGMIGVIVMNQGFEAVEITHGLEICQGAIENSEQAEFKEVKELSDTVRGEGGFGHTGVDGIPRPI